MHLLRGGSLPAIGVLAGAVGVLALTAVALTLVLPGFGLDGSSDLGGVRGLPANPLPPLAPPGHLAGLPPGIPAPPPVPALNGSPFLEVDSGTAYVLDDSLLPEEFTGTNATPLHDTYLLQAAPSSAGHRVNLLVAQTGDYASDLYSLALVAVAPGASVYAEEGLGGLFSASSVVPLLSAHDQNGADVSALLASPDENASSPAGSSLVATTGEVVTIAFGNVASADTTALLVRCSEDPSYSTTNLSGLSLQIANPATGIFGPAGFVACRDGWATVAVPLAGTLPAGTQVVTLRLTWVGTHGLAWVGLAEPAASPGLSPTTLLSATSNTGDNWTGILNSTSSQGATGQSVELTLGQSVALTYAVPASLPSGTSWALVTNGFPFTPPEGLNVSFTVAPTPAVAGQPVLFQGTATDPSSTVTSTAWSFGDGGSATGTNATHTFGAAGLYNVSFTATDARGITASAWASVNVTAAPPPPPPPTNDPTCTTTFACYVVNVTLSVTGTVGNNLTLTIGTGSGVWWSHCGPWDGRTCKPTVTELTLKVTRTNISQPNSVSGILVLPWTAQGENVSYENESPWFGGLNVPTSLTFNGTQGSNAWTLTFTTPFLTDSVNGNFNAGHHHPTTQVAHPFVGSALYWVLAGGLLVSFNASLLGSGSSPTNASWSFSAATTKGWGGHCAVDNLTCELGAGYGWGWFRAPPGFATGTWDNDSCASLAGTPYDAWVCGNASGLDNLHLFPVGGTCKVTVSLNEGGGTVTVVRYVHVSFFGPWW